MYIGVSTGLASRNDAADFPARQAAEEGQDRIGEEDYGKRRIQTRN